MVLEMGFMLMVDVGDALVIVPPLPCSSTASKMKLALRYSASPLPADVMVSVFWPVTTALAGISQVY